MKGSLSLMLLFVLCTSQAVTAQTKPVTGSEKQISPDLTAVEEFPKFPGNVNKYLADNIHYPAEAITAKKEGKVFTRFVVTATGEVTDIKVVQGVDPLLDAEAVRVLSSMPKWTPGKNNGQAIDVSLSLPISFTLENAHKQSKAKSHGKTDPPVIFTYVERMPEFDGGVSNYLKQNIRYPEDARKSRTEGKVILKFVIDDAGSVGDIQIVKAANPSLDAEAIRVLKSMPKWKPGMQNGKPVSVYYTLPVAFRL